MNLTVIEQNGQLLVDSREIAEMTGKTHAHLLRDIDGYMEVLRKSNFGLSDFFIETTYKAEGNNKTYKHYLLSRKGCDMVANKMTGEKGVLFTATYVTKFEEMENKLKDTQPKLPSTYKEALIALLEKVEENEKLEAEKKMLEADNKHKDNVIVGLVEDISLAEKRQILNQVVRKGGGLFQDRWSNLYKQFELKFHVNINKRMEGYNKNNKPKMKTKLDYIDKVMNQLDDLYDIACKLYQNDVEQLIKEMFRLNNITTLQVNE